MNTFTVPKEVRSGNIRTAILLLGLGLVLVGLGAWLITRLTIFNVISGVLGVSLGLFLFYGSIKTLKVILNSHPAIMIGEDYIEISGEKDPAENKRLYWSEIRQARLIRLVTAPYFEFTTKADEKVTAGYRFERIDDMIELVKQNLERFGIPMTEEIANPLGYKEKTGDD